MNRGMITAEVTSNMVKQKYKDFTKTFNPSKLASELRKLEGEHCNISSMNYIESFTKEKRKVTVLQFGSPVQLNIYMYT